MLEAGAADGSDEGPPVVCGQQLAIELRSVLNEFVGSMGVQLKHVYSGVLVDMSSEIDNIRQRAAALPGIAVSSPGSPLALRPATPMQPPQGPPPPLGHPNAVPVYQDGFHPNAVPVYQGGVDSRPISGYPPPYVMNHSMEDLRKEWKRELRRELWHLRQALLKELPNVLAVASRDCDFLHGASASACADSNLGSRMLPPSLLNNSPRPAQPFNSPRLASDNVLAADAQSKTSPRPPCGTDGGLPSVSTEREEAHSNLLVKSHQMLVDIAAQISSLKNEIHQIHWNAKAFEETHPMSAVEYKETSRVCEEKTRACEEAIPFLGSVPLELFVPLEPPKNKSPKWEVDVEVIHKDKVMHRSSGTSGVSAFNRTGSTVEVSGAGTASSSTNTTSIVTAKTNRKKSRLPGVGRRSTGEDGIKAPDLRNDGCAKPARMFAVREKKDATVAEYSVIQYYHETGYLQWIACHEHFSNLTMFIISVNAIFLGVDRDWNDAERLYDSDVGFIFMENFFCVYFTAEILIRFGAFKHKFDCVKDLWFKFDTALVLMMIGETWILPLALAGIQVETTPLRLIRLIRLSRMARLIRMFPELMSMIKGAGLAWRALSASTIAIVSLLYIFSIILNTLLKGTPELDPYFGTLPKAMWTLTMDGVFQDSPGAINKLMMYRTAPLTATLSVIVFMVFTIFSALMVLNMLIGAQCEVVSSVAKEEKENSDISVIKATMLVMLTDIDADGSGEIDKEELDQLLEDERAGRALEGLQIDKDALVNYLKMFYDYTESLTIKVIIETMLQFRGDREPNFKDLIDLTTYVLWRLEPGDVTGKSISATKKRASLES